MFVKSLKKYVFYVKIFCVCFIACQTFSSCTLILDLLNSLEIEESENNNSYALTDFSNDEDWLDSKYMYTLDSRKSSITLENLKAGQVILYANFNKGTSTISSNKIRATLSSSNNLNVSTSSFGASGVVPYTGSSGNSSVRTVLESSSDGFADTNGSLGNISGSSATSSDSSSSLSGSSATSAENFAKIKHFVPPVSNKKLFEQAKSSNTSSRLASLSRSANSPVTISDFKVGTSTKDIWIDNSTASDKDNDLDKQDKPPYIKANATLRAIGYDGGYTDADYDKPQDATPICLVWVPNDFWDASNSKGDKINSKVAHSIAQKFSKYYSLEREIFGEESDYLITSSGYLDTTSMKYNSSTGNFVNIVVYDIDHDYNPLSNTSVVGYFYSKDYFEKASYSKGSVFNYTNEGKYFYLDSAFCNYVSEGNYSGTGDVSGTAITTLFHEFQHMINFNNKDLKYLSSSTWYNEMLSMLAEDVLASELGFENSEDAVWNTRMPAYNQRYYDSALDEYRSGDYAVISYSTAYALGSYVARNYGGLKLIEEISKNDYADFDSIIKAIETVSGKQVSALKVYKEVIAASVFRDGEKKSSTIYSFAKDNNLPSFYKEESATYLGTTLRLPKISIFSDDYSYEYDGKSSKYYSGPLIMASGLASSKGLRGHCFNIHYAGSVVQDGNVTLNFRSSSGTVDSNEQVIVFVQDAFSNKVN